MENDEICHDHTIAPQPYTYTIVDFANLTRIELYRVSTKILLINYMYFNDLSFDRIELQIFNENLVYQSYYVFLMTYYLIESLMTTKAIS